MRASSARQANIQRAPIGRPEIQIHFCLFHESQIYILCLSYKNNVEQVSIQKVGIPLQGGTRVFAAFLEGAI